MSKSRRHHQAPAKIHDLQNRQLNTYGHDLRDFSQAEEEFVQSNTRRGNLAFRLFALLLVAAPVLKPLFVKEEPEPTSQHLIPASPATTPQPVKATPIIQEEPGGTAPPPEPKKQIAQWRARAINRNPIQKY